MIKLCMFLDIKENLDYAEDVPHLNLYSVLA